MLLELALVQYAMQTAVKRGYTPIITPDLARVEVLEGIGFMPRDPNPRRQVYTIANTDLCLIATAEITLGGMHRDQIFDESELPRRYVGLSHCFRTEAGAAGRDTRGLYRVHQFTKVEMFAFCTPEQSEAIHLEILAIEEEIFQGLGLPYHVIDTCTGDLGGPAYRKYDLEAWMPGRGEKRRVRRGDQHVELHRLPGAPARHPLQGEGAKGRGSSTRSTAPRSPARGRSSRSWRTTSRPTARSSSPRCCGRGSGKIGLNRRRKADRHDTCSECRRPRIARRDVGSIAMRTMNGFLMAGMLFLILALFTFVRSIFEPDHGNSFRGLLLFGTPLFPAMMGLVLIVAGYAAGLVGRSNWNGPRTT